MHPAVAKPPLSHAAAVAAILVLTTLAYLNSFAGVFQFDDHNVIVNNPGVHGWGAFLDGLSHGIRPLLKLTYVLDWAGVDNTARFHITNLGIHLGNALLVYFLSLQVVAVLAGEGPDRSRGRALLVALVFALHPVQTEAVTYISGRASSLMALLYFAAMLVYIRGRAADSGWLLYGAAPLLFLAGVAVKAPMVTLPAALLLWEVAAQPLQRSALGSIVRAQLPYWLLLLAMALVLLANAQYGRLVEIGYQARSLGENLMSELNGVTYLLSRLFLIGRLNIDPDLPVFEQWHPVLMVEALLLGGLLVTALVNRRRRPWLFFAILWFFLQLSPTTTLIPRADLANERHLYLAGWGPILVFVIGGARVLARRPPAPATPVTASILLVAVLAAFTVDRNRVYRTEVALWEDSVAKSPNKARPYVNLGIAYYKVGRVKAAQAVLETAVELEPRLHTARANLFRIKREPRRRAAARGGP